MKFFNNKNRITAISMFTVLALFAISFTPVYADIYGDLKTLSSSTDPQDKVQAEIDMVQRQIAVDSSFAGIKDRIDAMLKADPRRDSANKALSDAEKAKNAFISLPYGDPKNLLTDPYGSSDAFNKAEKDAINAISAVNRELLAPSKVGNVPEGDLVNDFIPGLIRMLFRFASLAILVAFVVSGTYFVIAFSDEARITKAKHMLYYTLIGFVFVVLAFAIVKAVTNINFFGII
jgi:hypothetical protein